MSEPATAPSHSPAQWHAWNWLRHARPCGSVFVLDGTSGNGRSTVASALARDFDAAFLRAGVLFEAMRDAHSAVAGEATRPGVR